MAVLLWGSDGRVDGGGHTVAVVVAVLLWGSDGRVGGGGHNSAVTVVEFSVRGDSVDVGRGFAGCWLLVNMRGTQTSNTFF